MTVLAAAANAQDDKIRYCFNAWPPYIYSKDGKAAGLSIEMLDEASRRAGLEAEYFELPWKRCLLQVRQGGMDAAIGAAKRDEYIQGPASYSVYSNTFWVQTDSTIRSFDLAAFSGKTVGLVTGYVYPDELVKNPPYAIDYSVDDETNMRKLAAGRVDAIVADLVSTKLAAEKQGLALRAVLPSHSFDALYPSFNKDKPALQSRINAALDAMRKDGFVARVYRERLNLNYEDLFAEPGR